MVTREIYWNIGFPGITLVMLILGLTPLFYIGYRMKQRWLMWRAVGQPEPIPPREEWWPRTQRLINQVAAQARLRRKTYAGLMHAGIFYSFVLLFIGTVIVAIQADFATPVLNWYFFQGWFYRVFSITLELAGLVGVAACGMALYRRYYIQPTYLGGRLDWTSAVWLLLVIMITGFVVEAARIAANPHQLEWENAWSFIGAGLSGFIPTWRADGAHRGVAEYVHLITWWGHLGISIAFLCLVGDKAMGHILTASYSIWMARNIPSGAVPRPIPNLEAAEVFGVLSIDQFSQTHLRDADSCVECGRCQDVCPAWMTGKPLSPKKIAAGVRAAWEPLALAKMRNEEPGPQPELVGDIITADELWSCTTCGACEQACPVFIEQIEKIVEMRRGLVLMRSEFPPEVQIAFSNLEQSGNPWGKPAEEREAWTSAVDKPVPIWGTPEAEGAEYLFWVGCAGAYDAKGQVVSTSFANVLHRAGVKFAILGSRETCTGDSPLRMGNDYLYQTLAKQNIETLNEAKPPKIVTACPHCFQTVGKDYKQLGGDYQVIHHSQLLDELLAAGRIPKAAHAMKSQEGRGAVFHDSCYLARHNKVVDEPRAVIASAQGKPAIEPERRADNGLCCGAGGGRMWMEEKLGHTHVNVERATELVATGAEIVVTSCPFCKTMLTDGVKEACGAKHGTPKPIPAVLDIAELLDRATKP